MAPVTTHVWASRAISLTGLRNSGSFAKKGAETPGQTIKSTLLGGSSIAGELRIGFRAEISKFVQGALNASRVQFASTGMFSCTSKAE